MSSRSPGSLSTRDSYFDNVSGAGGGVPATADDPAQEAQTRRAMIASAMGGIDRFKKSWISVMLLKSTIGLGQVAVLITLLVLASALDSPLSPYAKQSTPSSACPRPHLFQAWMAVNMARLTVCWGVSCWMCVRCNQRRHGPRLEDEETPAVSQHASVSHSDTMPSLSHSSSSGSSTTLAGVSSSSHTTPDASYSSRMDSQLSLAALAQYAMDADGRDEKSDGERIGASATITTRIKAPTNPAADSTPTLLNVTRPCARNELQAARDLHDGRTLGPFRRTQASRAAAILDHWAPTISKSLGAISAILFVLGNVMLFHPNPAREDTCYQAAPMLWWGVMTVVGIGWILLAQVFFVIIVVGLGGQAVLALLRRVGIITPTPEPEPARLPQPEVLTRAEVDRLKLVVYLPDPREARTEPTPNLDLTRLAHSPIYLPSHKATCAICQETFEPPKEARTILLQAEPLRQLGCGHVYHTECIDQWLLEGHGNCPFCNRAVRDTITKVG